MRTREAPNSVMDDHRRTNGAILFSRRGWGHDYDQNGVGAAQPAYAQYIKFKEDDTQAAAEEKGEL